MAVAVRGGELAAAGGGRRHRGGRLPAGVPAAGGAAGDRGAVPEHPAGAAGRLAARPRLAAAGRDLGGDGRRRAGDRRSQRRAGATDRPGDRHPARPGHHRPGRRAALAAHRAAPNLRHPALRPPGPGAPGGADQLARADPGPAFRGDAGGRGGHRGAAVAGAHVFLHQGRRPDGQLVRQPRRGAGGRRAVETLGAYLRGQATVGLIDGVFIGIGLAVVGVPLAVPLAFLVFLGAFLPIVGAFLSGLIAALVALVSKGLVAALIIVGITILVQQLEGHVLAPLVLGRAVKLPPAVILLALTGGGVVGGIIGAALAVPSVAVVTSVATYLRNRPPDPLPLGADGRAGVPQGQHDDRGGHRQGGEQDQHHAVVDPGDQPVGDGGGDRGGGDGDHPRPDDPPGDSPADR